MSDDHRPTYRALVAALRAEFNPAALEAIWIQMRPQRYNATSLGALVQAVHDARDIAYDAGEPPPTVADVLDWAAKQYRQCIVSARCTVDGYHYEKVNGRAEAYRQLANQVAAASGLPAPDWDAIREAVPADGIHR